MKFTAIEIVIVSPLERLDEMSPAVRWGVLAALLTLLVAAYLLGVHSVALPPSEGFAPVFS